MRRWMLMLLLLGCDSPAGLTLDMAMQTDLSMAPPDLSALGPCTAANPCGCKSYEACLNACSTQPCKDACFGHATSQAVILDFAANTGCLMRYCNSHADGGTVCTSVDLDPTSTTPFTTPCQDCLTAVHQQFTNGTLNFTTLCATEAAACRADTP